MNKITAAFIVFFVATSAWCNTSININEPKTITADKIEYDIKSKTFKTAGRTEIVNQSGQRMTLTDSYISKSNDTLTGEDIKLWLGSHVYLESDTLTRQGNITIARDALFTACAECDAYGDAWTITSSKVVHNADTRMLRFYNPVLWIYNDMPVLWFPFFEMPDPGVKHKSGLLMADFESTNNMGTQINLPFYWYISDTHDLTLTLAYLTKENPLFKLEHRLNTNHAEYRTKGSYTHNKAGENRWHIFNDDIIELGEYARATIFLERASDKTYLQKYGFYSAQPYLDSGAKVEVFGQSSYVVADMHIFQELRSNYSNFNAVPTGNILPNLHGVYQTTPLYRETYLLLNADILGVSGSDTTFQRMIGDARIISPWTLWGGNRLTLSLDTRYDVYNLHNTEMVDNSVYSGIKNRFLPSGYAQWGLPMFRPGTTWTQIIEPKVRLTVMRHTDDDIFTQNNDSAGAFLTDTTLFADNRFSGFDLWENGTFADYGARWAIFNNNDGRMFEIFLGQSYDFANSVDTNPNSGFHYGASDYVGRIEFNNAKWASLSSRFRFNRYDVSLRHMETNAHIGDNTNFINIGHMWSQKFIDTVTMGDTINEVIGGFGIQLINNWSARFNATYNVTYDKFQSHTGGLFYTHPCYYMSLSYRRDNATKEDYVGNTTFQFKIGMSIDGQKY